MVSSVQLAENCAAAYLEVGHEASWLLGIIPIHALIPGLPLCVRRERPGIFGKGYNEAESVLRQDGLGQDWRGVAGQKLHLQDTNPMTPIALMDAAHPRWLVMIY